MLVVLLWFIVVVVVVCRVLGTCGFNLSKVVVLWPLVCGCFLWFSPCGRGLWLPKWGLSLVVHFF